MKTDILRTAARTIWVVCLAVIVWFWLTWFVGLPFSEIGLSPAGVQLGASYIDIMGLAAVFVGSLLAFAAYALSPRPFWEISAAFAMIVAVTVFVVISARPAGESDAWYAMVLGLAGAWAVAATINVASKRQRSRVQGVAV